MTDQNTRHNNRDFQPGDVVQYSILFWDFLNECEPNSWYHDVVDAPMIILESNIPDREDFTMYKVLQGDKQFDISDSWVELVDE